MIFASLDRNNLIASGKRKFSLPEALNLLLNLPSESSDALIDDSTDQEVPGIFASCTLQLDLYQSQNRVGTHFCYLHEASQALFTWQQR
ncbi:UNVERIFIED_CONTAM: hypothetical protein NCL1_36653 [Trichonephila clavipes]